MMRSLLGLSLTITLAACGSVQNGNLADAPPSVDAAVDTITRGTVRVTVLDPGGSGAPAVGANVVFIDPDGTLVKRVPTDTAGKAEADVLPGASVTSIALSNTTTYQLQTVMAVKPGDDIVLGSKNADFSTVGTFTVNYPAMTGATEYDIAQPCGPSFVTGAPPATSVTFTITNNCKQSPMEIVVTPLDGNAMPMGTLSKSVAFVSGGSTTITGAYQPARSFTASYTNINPVVTSMFVSRGVPDGFGVTASQSISSPTPSQVVSLPGASGSNARIASRFIVSSTRAFQEVRQNISGTAATYGFDATTNLLPWVTKSGFDAASNKIVTTIDTTGTSSAQPDVFRLFASYRRTDPMTQVTTVFSWSVFAPQAGDVTLPALPPEVGNVAPTASDTVAVSVIMLEVDSIASYDAIRKDINDAIAVFGGSRSPAATVRLSAWPFPVRGAPTPGIAN